MGHTANDSITEDGGEWTDWYKVRSTAKQVTTRPMRKPPGENQIPMTKTPINLSFLKEQQQRYNECQAGPSYSTSQTKQKTSFSEVLQRKAFNPRQLGSGVDHVINDGNEGDKKIKSDGRMNNNGKMNNKCYPTKLCQNMQHTKNNVKNEHDNMDEGELEDYVYDWGQETIEEKSEIPEKKLTKKERKRIRQQQNRKIVAERDKKEKERRELDKKQQENEKAIEKQLRKDIKDQQLKVAL